MFETERVRLAVSKANAELVEAERNALDDKWHVDGIPQYKDNFGSVYITLALGIEVREGEVYPQVIVSEAEVDRDDVLTKALDRLVTAHIAGLVDYTQKFSLIVWRRHSHIAYELNDFDRKYKFTITARLIGHTAEIDGMYSK